MFSLHYCITTIIIIIMIPKTPGRSRRMTWTSACERPRPWKESLGNPNSAQATSLARKWPREKWSFGKWGSWSNNEFLTSSNYITKIKAEHQFAWLQQNFQTCWPKISAIYHRCPFFPLRNQRCPVVSPGILMEATSCSMGGCLRCYLWWRLGIPHFSRKIHTNVCIISADPADGKGECVREDITISQGQANTWCEQTARAREREADKRRKQRASKRVRRKQKR